MLKTNLTDEVNLQALKKLATFILFRFSWQWLGNCLNYFHIFERKVSLRKKGNCI